MPQLTSWRGVHNINHQGIIDRHAVTAFTNGHCHSFAIALHHLTGWPIVGLGFTYRGDYKLSPGHVVVFSPELNDYIDIEGRGARERWQEQDDSGPLSEWALTEDEARSLEMYKRTQLRLAKPYAITVLEKVRK